MRLMLSDSPIVITGLGLASSLGTSPEESFSAVVAGRCDLGSMSVLEQTPEPDKGGGQAMDLPTGLGDRAPREARYLRYVIEQALHDAGTHPYSPARVSAVMGTTLHGMRAGGRYLRSGDVAELRAFPAGAVLREALRGTSVEGARLSTCSACSSGLGAIALGITLLRSGEADMVIAGGYDAVSEYAYAGFESLRLIAAGDPRPFGASRDGMKTAEGYAAVVLERESDATARGARLRGYLAGFGESADAHHLTQPHPSGSGARIAIMQALETAGVAPEDIHLISAHATATPGNDASEYAALSAAFGNKLPGIPVVAFKSHLGHTLGGAGAVELVLAVLARERGLIPPTLNALPLDPAFPDLKLNHGIAKSSEIASTLNLSLGFGGANTCVVITSARPRASGIEPDEAVITGVGVVFPDAVGNERFVEFLSAQCDGSFFRTGAVSEESIAHLLSARRVRRMSDYVKLTLAATTVACEHASIDDPPTFAERACVLLGTMHGSANFCEAYYSQIFREGLAGANPALFAEGVPNAAAAQLSLMLGVRGGCQTIIGSRAAGLDALRLAALRIREGVWSRAFIGAAEEHCETVNLATTACCGEPRLGFCAGAVTVILESRRCAVARGARVLGTIQAIAVGATDDALIATSLDGTGSEAHRSRADSSASPPVWSASGVIPDCFSVGGLAALAAILLAPRAITGITLAPGSSALVLGSDAATGITGIRVRF